MRASLTLPNRGVLFGVTTVDLMLAMAEQADATGLFASVWVGDSLLGKPRMESMVLLAGIAARTKRVKLGPACMASFPLRDPVLLAHQWASLDLLAAGRSILVACTGLVEQEGGMVEGQLYGLQRRDRITRMVEWMAILRLLWTQDNAAFEGRHYRFSGVTVDPKPVAKPHPPIWIANNAKGDRARIIRTLRRAAVVGDGWQTSIRDPEDLAWRIPEIKRQVIEAGKDLASYPICLYHNININEDRQAALDESKRFLDLYYAPVQYSPQDVAHWCAAGSPRECVEHLSRLRDLGATEICLRITSWDQRGQFKRLIEEVLPRLYATQPV